MKPPGADPRLPPPLPASARPGPLGAADRVETVDVLRGFALFGILAVNMAFFATPIYFIVTDFQWGSGPLDRPVENGILFFAQGKFYVLFSFLFGWGLSVQMLRSAARGEDAAPRFRRRLVLLLGIGLAHAVLIWHGDILAIYALLGFVLLAFRKCRDRTLLVWTAILMLLPILWNLALVGLIELGRIGGAAAEIEESFVAAEAEYIEAAERSLDVFANGSFGEIVAQRLGEYWFAVMGGFLFGGLSFHILAMFLLGLLAGRRGYFHEPAAHPRFFRRLLVIGLVVGVAANWLVLAGHETWQTIEPTVPAVGLMAALYWGGPALTGFYIAAIVLLLQRPCWRSWLQALFAAVGRTALTNYLFQSVVGTLIFYSYGLGYFGRLGPAFGLVLTFAIFGVQVFLSRWWLQRFRFGPVEWLWRSFTYGRRQPFRIGDTEGT